MSKELWIDSFEEIYQGLLEIGCPDDIAYELASEKAHDHMTEKLADRIDMERMRRKDER